MKLFLSSLLIGTIGSVVGAPLDQGKWWNWLACEQFGPFLANDCQYEQFEDQVWLAGGLTECDPYDEEAFPVRTCEISLENPSATVHIPVVNWGSFDICNKNEGFEAIARNKDPNNFVVQPFAKLDGSDFHIYFLNDENRQLFGSCAENDYVCSLSCDTPCTEDCTDGVNCIGLDNSPSGGWWASFTAVRGNSYEIVVGAKTVDDFCIGVKHILNIN